MKKFLLVGVVAFLGFGCGGDDEHICDKIGNWTNKCGFETASAADINECKTGYDEATAACRSAAAAFVNCITKLSCSSVQENSCQAESDKADSVCED